MFYLFEKIMSILNGSVSSVFLIYIYEPVLGVMILITYAISSKGSEELSCADLESFVREGPTLTNVFLFVCFLF